MNTPLSRRSFLARTAAAGAVALTPTLGTAAAANDAITVACLGTGGRCRHLMKSLVKVPGVKIVALADV